MRASLLSLALCVAVIAELQADEGTAKQVAGEFPVAGLEVVGSGSGLLVGPKLVLTNRHVVELEDGVTASGFRAFLGPDYSKNGVDARVVFVCDDYDLALIELRSEVDRSPVPILDALVPLGTKVTAYGFPLGDIFGVALTVTGGQVSRHPVAAGTTGTAEELKIKRSIWHDAVTTSGSSGGPMVTENGTLVAVHWGALNKQAFAIASPQIVSFIRHCKAEKGMPIVPAVDGKKHDPASAVAYIQVLGTSSAPAPVKKDLAGAISAIATDLEQRLLRALPHTTDLQLQEVAKGDVTSAFTPTPAASVKQAELTRIQGRMSIIQITDGGILANIDGVKFKIILLDERGGELRAKLGDGVILDIPHDGVYYVGKAQEYTTIRGDTSYYIPLYGAAGFLSKERLEKLLTAEKSRRRIEAERIAAWKAEEAEIQRKKSTEKLLQRLRRTWRDESGKFSVDAYAVANGDRIKLLRVSDNAVIEVSRGKLCAEDIDWLTKNDFWVKRHGPTAIDFFK